MILVHLDLVRRVVALVVVVVEDSVDLDFLPRFFFLRLASAAADLAALAMALDLCLAALIAFF